MVGYERRLVCDDVCLWLDGELLLNFDLSFGWLSCCGVSLGGLLVLEFMCGGCVLEWKLTVR